MEGDQELGSRVLNRLFFLHYEMSETYEQLSGSSCLLIPVISSAALAVFFAFMTLLGMKEEKKDKEEQEDEGEENGDKKAIKKKE